MKANRSVHHKEASSGHEKTRRIRLPFFSQYIKLPSRRAVIKSLPLLAVLAFVAASFFYGWYFDTSKPQSGAGWADQSLYTSAAEYLAHGQLLTPHHLHFAIGYPLLGAVGYYLAPADPFMPVSLVLILASAAFCFFAVRHLFGTVWAVLFCALLFAWDGVTRTFHYSSELFAVPWNNQVLFFAFAFFLWLFVTRLNKPPSLRLAAAAGLVSGLAFITREESILFVVPAMAVFFLATKAHWRQWLLCFAIIGLCFLPQAIMKTTVLGSIAKSGHDAGYSQTLGNYFQPSQLYRNGWETIIDSNHFDTSENVQREALLQTAPWLWLSPVGIGLILFLKRYPLGLKIFVLLSGALILFYLSGVNMSAQKLQFHCLRYISPGFIALNLGVMVVAHFLFTTARDTIKRRRLR